MEQKKVQRIIGIVVVIALVIVVMPLLFGKSDFPVQEAANIKAPPFPDQTQSSEPQNTDTQTTNLASAADANTDTNVAASQTNSATTISATTPEPTIANGDASTAVKLPEPPVLSTQIDPVAVDNKPADAGKIDATASSPANDAKPAPATGSIIYEPASVSTTAVTPEVGNQKPVEQAAKTSSDSSATSPTISITEDSAAVVNKAPPTATKEKHIHVKTVKALHAKAKNSTFNKLGSQAWAVQMGNFSVKKNAVHLANILQAAGYKSFVKEIKFNNGQIRTRVYIGPELKQASAKKVSNEVQQKLSLQGFVVSYNPTKLS